MIFFRKKGLRERILDLLKALRLCVEECHCVAVTTSPDCVDEVGEPVGAVVKGANGLFYVVLREGMREWMDLVRLREPSTAAYILHLDLPSAVASLLLLLGLNPTTQEEFRESLQRLASKGLDIGKVFRVDVAPLQELKNREANGVVVEYGKCGALVYEKSKLGPEQVKKYASEVIEMLRKYMETVRIE